MVARPGVHDPGRRLLLRHHDRAASALRLRRRCSTAKPCCASDCSRCRCSSSSAWAASTTGSTGPRGARRARRTTPATARTPGRTTSASNTDHKVIGIQYVVTSFFFLFVGGLLAMLMRAELAAPGPPVRRRQHLQRPLQRPRLAADLPVHHPGLRGPGELRAAADDRRAGHGLPAPERAVLLDAAGRRHDDAALVPGSRRLVRHRLDGLRAAVAPRRPVGQEFFTIAVQFAGASSIATALNFLVTIITMRAPGMSFFRMPLLVWANFSTSLLVVIATPFIAASQFFVLLDRALGFNFFDPTQGGDVLMYQHVFWFYSHPAVYIMMLPGFGIISEILVGQGPQADLRLPDDGLLAAGHRRARLHRVGAPHVRLGHAAVDPRPDDGHHGDHRRPDRDQDLLVAGDAVARRAAPRHADALRPRLPDDVHAAAGSPA